MRSSAGTVKLLAQLRGTAVQPSAVAELLDGLGTGDRVDAVRALGRAEQRRLFEAVDGFAPRRLSDLVPPETDELATLRHFGRNTLPLFSRFEKRFCRPRGEDAAKPALLYGFNFGVTAPLTGPGYFVAREDTARGEVVIDYREIPAQRPTGWPALRANDRGIARLVYGAMVDTLLHVSLHVSIGSAARRGRALGSWFVLCREA